MFGIPIAVLVGGLAVVGAALLFALYRSISSGRRRVAADAPGRASAPVTWGAVHVSEPVRLEPRTAFARPGMRGPLFQYGGNGPGVVLDLPFAVVAVQTTGFSPDAGDRIVEVAVARVDARGRITDEYSTLVDPGRDVGPIFVHGITGSDVREAPTFEEIAGELLARMDGAIVVAHNAVVEERFLAAEFGADRPPAAAEPGAGRAVAGPADAGRASDELSVLARSAGLPSTGGHGALTDVRTVAPLLPRMLAALPEPPRFLTGSRPLPELECDTPPGRGWRRTAARAPGWPCWCAGCPGGHRGAGSRCPALPRRTHRRPGRRADRRRREPGPGATRPDGRPRRRGGRRPAPDDPRLRRRPRSPQLHPHHGRDPPAEDRRQRPRAARVLRRPEAHVAAGPGRGPLGAGDGGPVGAGAGTPLRRALGNRLRRLPCGRPPPRHLSRAGPGRPLTDPRLVPPGPDAVRRSRHGTDRDTDGGGGDERGT